MSPRKHSAPAGDTVRRFHRLMGALDGPMVIVTTRDVAGERSGCLVGFTTQCSIDPPRFLVCLSDKNHTYRVAQRAEQLAVHVVPRDRRDLAELFGGATDDEVDKFGLVAWHDGPGGVPVLEGCPDWFVGRIVARHRLGDHVGFVLDLVAAAEHAPGGEAVRLHDVLDLEPGHEA